MQTGNGNGEGQTVAHRGRRNADEALALALATGQTLRAAADLAGIGERTAARRWADRAFRGRVSALQWEMVRRSVGRMADGMTEAADVLRRLLAAESENVRLGAARTLLDLGLQMREVVDLEQRLAELEEQFGATGRGGGK